MKNLYCSLMFVIVSVSAGLAQGTGLVRYGGNASLSSILQILPAENNGYIAIGYNSANHNRDIIKLDQDFNVLWSKSYSNSDITGFPAKALARLNDGNYAVLGFSSLNTGSALVIKLAPDGTMLFERIYSFPNDFLTVFSINAAAGSDNGFVLAGGACARNNFLIKCHANGNVEWAKDYNDFTAPGVKSAFSVLPDNTGYTVASNISGVGGADVTVMRVEASGNLLWLKQLKHDNVFASPKSIIRLSNGGLAILATGGTNGPAEMIYFIDPACTTITTRGYYSPVDMDMVEMADDGASGIVVVGRHYVGVQNEQALYFKVSYTGDIAWKKITRGTSSTNMATFYGVTRSANNKIVMSGSAFHSGQVVGVIDAAGAGLCVEADVDLTAVSTDPVTIVNKNVFPSPFTLDETPASYITSTANLAKNTLCGMVAAASEQELPAAFELYPNPATGNITLQLADFASGGMVTIYNALGQKVAEEAVEAAQKKQIWLANAAAGVYLVQYSNGSQRYSSRLVVE